MGKRSQREKLEAVRERLRDLPARGDIIKQARNLAIGNLFGQLVGALSDGELPSLEIPPDPHTLELCTSIDKALATHEAEIAKLVGAVVLADLRELLGAARSTIHFP